MWRYKLLLFIFFLPLTICTLWQSLSAFNPRYFLQRLALLYNNKIVANGLWVHAASVGEVNAVIPLLKKINELHPGLAITLTTNTTTSALVAEKQLTNIVQHIYFPLDYRCAVKRLIKKINPKTVFIVETELWPNLYTELNKQNIPLMIINGRVSEKTIHANNWLKYIYALILSLVTYVYARSETDQERFISLGLPENKTEVLGNIKFSSPENENISPMELGRKYVLAASTRDDEEQVIVDAWIKSEHTKNLLVIVPRHPQRLTDILKQLKSFNLNIAVRSKNDHVSEETDIYIADTIGELKQFIAGSEFVLMGGSFVEKGGHNILEVAQLGKAVIFGPDMRNFMDEAKAFNQYKAGIQCALPDLTHTFNQFLSDKAYRVEIENNAKNLIKDNNNLGKYIQVVQLAIAK